MSRGAIGYNARGMAEVKKRILFEIAHVFHRHSFAAKADPTLGYYGELRFWLGGVQSR